MNNVPMYQCDNVPIGCAMIRKVMGRTMIRKVMGTLPHCHIIHIIPIAYRLFYQEEHSGKPFLSCNDYPV